MHSCCRVLPPYLKVGLPQEDEGIFAAGRDGRASLGREGDGGNWLLVAEEVEDGARLKEVENFNAAIEGRGSKKVATRVEGHLQFHDASHKSVQVRFVRIHYVF